MRTHEKHPRKAGADLCCQAGNQHLNTANHRAAQDDLSDLRARHLMRALGLQPQRASILAGLAFGGAV